MKLLTSRINPAAIMTILCVLGAIWANAILAETSDAQKPNIVLFLTDDTNWFDIGPYDRLYDYTPGNAITPNLDKLASEGMMFTSAFTATAMCSPTRQQLYTGIYPVRNGAYPNHGVAYDGTKSIAHYFGDMGYRVGLAGKGHVNPRSVYPFEKVGEDIKGESGLTTFGIEGVEDFVKQDSKQPFFIIIASNNSHGPWTRGDRSLYDAKTINVPSFLIDTPQFRNDLVRYYAEISDLDNEVGLVDDLLDQHNLVDNTIFVFASEQGAGMPFAKFTTYDAGLKTAFIMRWPNHIESDTRSDALVQYVDVVPTLMEAVGQAAPSGIDGRSFYPVIKDNSREHRDYVYGVQTTRNIINGSDYPIRSIRDKQYKLIVNLLYQSEFSNGCTAGISKGRGMLGDWQKAGLAGNKRALERVSQVTKRPLMELYDVLKDPFEEDNIANEIGSQQVIDRMLPKLIAWMDQQGDKGALTELSACERAASFKACP